VSTFALPHYLCVGRERAVGETDELYTADQCATLTGLSVSGFREKVRLFGIKGLRQGKRLYYSQDQLDDVKKGITVEVKEAEKLRLKASLSKDKVADYKKQSADYLLARRLKKT
jgi:hypothetical protein